MGHGGLEGERAEGKSWLGATLSLGVKYASIPRIMR